MMSTPKPLHDTSADRSTKPWSGSSGRIWCPVAKLAVLTAAKRQMTCPPPDAPPRTCVTGPEYGPALSRWVSSRWSLWS